MSLNRALQDAYRDCARAFGHDSKGESAGRSIHEAGAAAGRRALGHHGARAQTGSIRRGWKCGSRDIARWSVRSWAAWAARPISPSGVRERPHPVLRAAQWEKRTDLQHVEGRLEGDVLRGETTDEKGRRVGWEARRAPSLKRAQKRRVG